VSSSRLLSDACFTGAAMAGATPSSLPPERASSKKKSKKKNVKGSLRWTNSPLSDDPFSLLSGSEGGIFFSLWKVSFGLVSLDISVVFSLLMGFISSRVSFSGRD
jgi:hypothetical protein